jgi:hypothetical protein
MTDDRPVPSDPKNDDEVWDLVAAVPVPPPAEGFMPTLQERIAGESRAAARSAPSTRRRPRWRLAAVLGAAALAAAVFVLFGVPGAENPGPPPATAGQLAVRLRTALAQAKTIQGLVTVRTHSTWPTDLQDSPSTTWTRFVGTAAGDWRLESTDIADKRTGGPSTHVATLIYNAAENTWVTVAEEPVNAYDPTAGTQRVWRRTVGYWPGVGATPGVAMLARVQPWLGTALAALNDDAPGTSVDAVTYLGRPAWRTSFGRTVGDPVDGDGSRDSYVIVVDADTGLIVHGSLTSTEMKRGVTGTTRSTFDVTDLRVDAPVPAGSFSTRRPELSLSPGSLAGETVARDGTCTLRDAVRRVGYRPPVPTWTPAGYRRVAVATCPPLYAGISAVPGPLTGTQPRDAEIGLTYRRGFETFWVEVAPLSVPPGGSGEALVRHGMTPSGTVAPERATVASGALKGSHATTGYAELGVGLLVFGRDVAVFIGGDLTRKEALGVASSLRWHDPAEGGR